MFKESLRISLYSIKRKKVTSALTILGLVIGIAAIVSLISIGSGLENAISSQLEEFGADKIMVMASMTGGMSGPMASGQTLSDSDADMIEDISGVNMAVGMYIKTSTVKYNDETVTTYVMGLPGKQAQEFFSDIQSIDLEKGKFFKQEDGRVAVIGNKLAHNIFDKDVRIGSYLEISNQKFKVIGIMKSAGDPEMDQAVMMPLDTARNMYEAEDELTMVYVKASDETRVDYVAKKIEEELDDKYGENTYMAMTSEQMMETIGTIFSIISLFLGGIASIALLVAGVGITNTMFMSVMERTREIGVMKAIGATNIKILEIFLIESALIGLIGGIIGCVLGFAISYAVSFAAV
ncbi:MAG: ABC transporter permease [Candidatus Aenigmarchaeota archaeon]|nr:ABC transporter permease [Candidatus Aenigmarchaeota archaeon]